MYLALGEALGLHPFLTQIPKKWWVTESMSKWTSSQIIF